MCGAEDLEYLIDALTKPNKRLGKILRFNSGKIPNRESNHGPNACKARLLSTTPHNLKVLAMIWLGYENSWKLIWTKNIVWSTRFRKRVLQKIKKP